MKRGFVPTLREIFNLPGFLADPLLSLGYKDDFSGEDFPEDFRFKHLKDLLLTKGLKSINHVDLFDSRAELKYDLNLPVPPDEHEKYQTLMDIGTLEHVFDTRQCIESSFRMLRVSGSYFLATSVKGYFGHGLHTFHPELILGVLKVNDFDVTYLRYTTSEGEIIKDPASGGDVLIWVVAKKTRTIGKFLMPQQEMWRDYYKDRS